MTIHVTQEDIDMGIKSECRYCPIARAMNRANPGFWASAGFGSLAFWKEKVMKYSYAIPEIVRNFMTSFDAGKPVSPFSFEL